MHALHARLTPGLRRHFERKLGGGPNAGAQSELADELVQRTWILLWESVSKKKYDPAKSRLTTFLYAAASLVLVRYRAGQKWRAKLDERYHAIVAPGESSEDPAKALELAQLLDELRRVLSGESGEEMITAQDRQTLQALSQGRTDRELALEQNVSPSTAHARKQTALERVRAFLRKRGLGQEDGRAPGEQGV